MKKKGSENNATPATINSQPNDATHANTIPQIEKLRPAGSSRKPNTPKMTAARGTTTLWAKKNDAIPRLNAKILIIREEAGADAAVAARAGVLELGPEAEGTEAEEREEEAESETVEEVIPRP